MMQKRANTRRYEIPAVMIYLICMITSIAGGLLTEHVISNENLLQALEKSSIELVISTVLTLNEVVK
ncbi:hypothetical protein [Clostridium sp. E02]|uniref:hypothetical protein n=1 Tax=Clostridium sp. E02 TaxID=2487134 RepID=UPI000F522246|nr:hypothetical protein [Clostridium sp. E02]